MTSDKKRKSQTFTQPGVCIRCHKEYVRTGARQLYCLPCRALVKTERDAGYNAKLVGPVKSGKLFSCARCGCDFTKKSGSQKYCDDCRISAQKERWRTISRNQRRKPGALEKERARYRRRKNTDTYREGRRLYERMRHKEDPGYAIHRRMKAMVSNALRGIKNGRSWPDLVGYTKDELMTHIERQFVNGMTWNNREKWHIDHIIPQSSFSFKSTDDPEFKACWALTNLRPLWSLDNKKKSDNRTLLL